MTQANLIETLDRVGDIIRLSPQMVGRFYTDLKRLGQRGDTPYRVPERWIGSSTQGMNPPEIPTGGLSTCPALQEMPLRDLVAHGDAGPRLLGEKRFVAHGGTFCLLTKILDAGGPIPFHVHATDQFVAANPQVYPNERFGKTEAYHFLESPKGDTPYTHIGVYPGVDARTMLATMDRGGDHLLELSPGAMQNYGEGFIVESGLLHRPGTALTLEIQQPSDVYTIFQREFGGQVLDDATLAPGFAGLQEAAERTVDWQRNLDPQLLESSRLRPQPVTGFDQSGARCEWIYPPDRCEHFSGQRLTIDTRMTFKAEEPCVLFVWNGRGALAGQAIDGRGGPPGEADEFFLGNDASRRGVEIVNTGDEPLVVFALFAATC